MNKIRMTVEQIKDLKLWEKVCEYKGWDPNGYMSSEKMVEFDTKFDAQFTNKEKNALEDIASHFSRIYAIYFNKLSPEQRYKIDNIIDVPKFSLSKCIREGEFFSNDALKEVETLAKNHYDIFDKNREMENHEYEDDWELEL